MWINSINQQITEGYRKTTKWMFIYFIITYSTSFIDSTISYFAKIPFVPGTYSTYIDVIMALACVIICTGFILLLKRCNSTNVPLRVLICIAASLICYPYVLEGNLLGADIDKAIISYKTK